MHPIPRVSSALRARNPHAKGSSESGEVAFLNSNLNSKWHPVDKVTRRQTGTKPGDMRKSTLGGQFFLVLFSAFGFDHFVVTVLILVTEIVWGSVRGSA